MTERESATINTELTKNAVEIRQIVQDFPLCSTFKEIDEQNALGDLSEIREYSSAMLFSSVRRHLEIMRGNISKLETVGRETLDLEESHGILEIVERHKEQLTACQRQFRLANVKVSLFQENFRLLGPDIDPDLQVLELSGAEVPGPGRGGQWRSGPQVQKLSEVPRELAGLAGHGLVDVVPVVVGVEDSLLREGTEEDGQGELVEVSDRLLGLLVV